MGPETYLVTANDRSVPDSAAKISHVVVVTDSLDVDGGSGKVAISTAIAIAESGTRATVFAASGSSRMNSKNLQFVTTNQGTILNDPAKINAAARGLYNFEARKKLSELLSTCDPDTTVVHVHSWTKALSSSIFDAIRESEIPLVITLHEYFVACPTGSLYLHGSSEICHLSPMSARCIATNCDSRSFAYKGYRVLRQIIQRDIVRVPAKNATLVTVSDFSRNVLQPLIQSEHKIHVVRNPIDAVQQARVSAEDHAAYAYVGRLSPEKGAALFAAAARKANVDAVFIGDGEDRGAIMRANPDARIFGWVSPESVLALLRRTRTIVMPSLWYETFGLVVLEGAALGIPSIVPHGTAPADSVINGQTGTTFQRGDVDDLAAKLRSHVPNAVIKRLSQNAYEAYWADPLPMNKHLKAIFAIYDSARRKSRVSLSREDLDAC